MRQLLYKTIYNDKINLVLRNINKFLSPILPKAIKIPPSGILTIKYAGRRLKIKCNQTSYVTFLLFWNGFENYEYTGIFMKLIKKVNTFYDIGANLGYYSLLGKMEHPELSVVCFEPADGPLFYLRENISLNNFKNIKAESIALSHKSGEIEFYEVKNKKYTYLEYNLAGESNAGSKTTGLNFIATKVKTITLDEYVITNKVESIDLIKMDTEGTENLILAHSDLVLREMKPIIICETLFNVIEPLLEEILSEYGYEFYNESETGLKKVATIRREIDNGVRNCFFVHPSKFEFIEEFIEK